MYELCRYVLSGMDIYKKILNFSVDYYCVLLVSFS